MKISRVVLFSALAFSMAIISCTKDDPQPVVLSAVTVSNLQADPPTGGYSPTTGQPIGVTNKFTLFSFKTGVTVLNSDSASTKWDIGFKGTTIIVNSGTSGPGTAGAFVQPGIFDELTTAPSTGFRQDNKNAATNLDKYAISTGSDNGWYHYNGATNVITPLAGRVIVVRTSEGKFAKVEILSYYKDAPAAPSSSSIDRHYTLRYVYQADGSTRLQ